MTIHPLRKYGVCLFCGLHRHDLVAALLVGFAAGVLATWGFQ